MGKTKTASPDAIVKDLVVIWWDGFNKEHQATAGGGEEPIQWEFALDEATAQCKNLFKKGALKVEIWRPGDTPEKVAAFRRALSGYGVQTFPSKQVVLKG